MWFGLEIQKILVNFQNPLWPMLRAWHHFAVQLSWPHVVHCIFKRLPFLRVKTSLFAIPRPLALLRLAPEAGTHNAQDKVGCSDNLGFVLVIHSLPMVR